jgi:hypothetical protein
MALLGYTLRNTVAVDRGSAYFHDVQLKPPMEW